MTSPMDPPDRDPAAPAEGSWTVERSEASLHAFEASLRDLLSERVADELRALFDSGSKG